jgi:hypothetical protein
MPTIKDVTIEIGDLGSTGTFTIYRGQDDLIRWGVDLHIDTTPLITLSEVAGSDLFEIFLEMIDYGCVEDVVISDGTVVAEGEVSLKEVNRDGGHITVSFQGQGPLYVTRHQHGANQSQPANPTMYEALMDNNIPMRGQP